VSSLCTIEDLYRLVDSGRRFATIYADPPWPYRNRACRGAASNHYPTMSIEDICGLPVAQLAAPNAHLHLWTTASFVFESFDVIRAWGFRHEGEFIWIKPQMGLGNYWRICHEHLMLGVRGELPFGDNEMRDWGIYPRRKHRQSDANEQKR